MTEVTSYLQNELDKARRRLRVTLIAMGVVSVVMIGYFEWIKSLTDEILEPDNVADLVVNELRGNLPQAGQVLRDGLVSSAPDMVRFVMQQVVDSALPAITESLSAEVKRYSQEAARVGKEGVLSAFTTTLRECKASVAKRKKPMDEAAWTEHATACVRSDYEKQLDAAAADVLGGELTASAQTLNKLNTRLKSLATRKQLTRQDELGKQLVTTWWTFLDRNHGHTFAAPEL
jgi:hypothetical protein